MDKLYAGLPASDLVATLYRGLLRREPDFGAPPKVERLQGGTVSVETLVAEFLSCDEFLALKAGAPGRLTNDQSQFGEFELLIRRWSIHAAPHQIVVDVGARGRERSNSYDLMRSFGWRGVLIEANPHLINAIAADFTGLDLDLVHCAVSDYDGEATFHLGVNDDVSSLNEAASAGWGPVAGTVEVPVRRLAPLLEARDVPHAFGLLSIDIEGEDVRVLNDLVGSSDYRPGWVIIEASYDYATRSLEDLPLHPAVLEAYDLVAQTRANLILEQKRL